MYELIAGGKVQLERDIEPLKHARCRKLSRVGRKPGI